MRFLKMPPMFHAADRFDLGPGNGLFIRHDGKRFEGGFGEL